jgi:hypothetical protein
MMRWVGGGGDAAGNLPAFDAVGQEGEGDGVLVARLRLHAVPGDGAAVEARGGASLEAANT